jgi:hypothetical protein
MIKRSVAIGTAAACVAAGAVLTLAPSSATAASSGAVAVTPTATWGTDGKVYSMTKVDNTIYLAGTFKNLVNPKTGKKQPAANIGAIDATTGKPIATFAAGTNGLIYSVRTSADGSTVYVGGVFTAADGVARKNLAAFSADTGAVTSWAPRATVAVRALLPLGDKVIVGGDFTWLNGVSTQRIGAVDTATGANYPGWNTSATCRVQVLTPTPDGQSFYAGGYAQYWNGTYQPGIVRMSATSGQLDPSFNARYAANQMACEPVHHHGGNNPFDIYVQPSTGSLVVSVGGTNNILDGLSSSGARYWRDYADGDFQTATVLGDYIYAGGHFRSHIWDSCGNNFVPEHIVRINPRNGCVDASWTTYMYPHDQAGHYYGTWSLINDGTNLYAGGEFKSTESYADGKWVFRKSPSYAVFTGLSS